MIGQNHTITSVEELVVAATYGEIKIVPSPLVEDDSFYLLHQEQIAYVSRQLAAKIDQEMTDMLAGRVS